MTPAIRMMRESDVAPLDALIQTAYEMTASSEHRLRAAFASPAARTFVWDEGDGPIGMVTLHDYGTTGYVALLAVDPGAQSRGIGRRLMDVVVADSAQCGHHALALEASEAGLPLDEKMGFATLGMTLNGSAPRAKRASRARRATSADADAVLACDRGAFGSDRSGTLFPVFAQPESAIFVTDSADGISGFAVARHGRISPLMSSNAEDAAALYDAASAMLPNETVRLSLPAENAEAKAVATSRGWEESSRNTHMVLGERPIFPRRQIYALISLGEG